MKTHRVTQKKKQKDIYFRPNLTPKQIFQMGSFGGTYWRPIYSKVTGKKYEKMHHKYSWSNLIPESKLSEPNYDIQKNKYKVKVGTSLRFWEDKGWITEHHPYGWMQWYCDYHMGERGPDDERQMKRWQRIAGPDGRFMRFLVTQIKKKGGAWNDESISPKIRQVLQHWGYKLTKKDYDNELKRRNIKK
mgnify:CR=1 FL=1|jgi:hypothetical protein